MPGAVFMYKGRRYIMSGQLSGGTYLRAVGVPGKKNFPVKQCDVVAENAGLVYLS